MLKLNIFCKKISLTTIFTSILIFLSTSSLADNNTSPNNIINTNNVVANSTNNNNITLSQIPTFWRFNFELVKMPDANEKNMGLLGLNYLFKPTNWLYAGVGGYAAVSGERGGLFVLGLEGGVQHRLIGDLYGDAGLYVGGGGGKSSLVGSGLMLRPHIGLAYDFCSFKLGLDLSQVRFPSSGNIKSTEASLVLSLPGNFTYTSPENANQFVSVLSDMQSSIFNYLNFSENYISILEDNYLQTHSVDTNGQSDSSTIRTVGVELSHFINKHVFFLVRGSGGFSGNHNGYMDALAGIGYRIILPFLPRFSISGRAAVGAGGGGNVNVGGGVLVEPSVGLAYQITPKISAELAGGYLYAPDGKFNAYTITARLSYRLFFGNLGDEKNSSIQEFLPFELAEWRVRVIDQIYFKPQRKAGLDDSSNVNLIGVKIDTFVNRYFYITGQGNSAFAGPHAGGYSSGLLGLGVRSKPLGATNFELNAEVLAGAGGGGNMDVGGGFIINPIIGLTYRFNPTFGLMADIGRIYAPKGRLNATTVDLGLLFDFATVQK